MSDEGWYIDVCRNRWVVIHIGVVEILYLIYSVW